MKPYIQTFSAALLFTFTITLSTYAQDKSSLYESVLQQNVRAGLVNYAGIKSNPGQLNEYLKQTSLVSNEEFNSWSKDAQLAFLINLYNAQTLDLVADNYPVDSIKDIARDSGGPWEQPVVNLFDEKITLNALEHEVIRKKYPEARVHFALVCAALGCPVLIDTPYKAEILEDQLDRQTKVFLLDKSKNSIDTNTKVLRLSPIFDWFKEDFISQSGSVIAFVNPYFGNRANNSFKIEYTNYDWSLNDQQ